MSSTSLSSSVTCWRSSSGVDANRTARLWWRPPAAGDLSIANRHSGQLLRPGRGPGRFSRSERVRRAIRRLTGWRAGPADLRARRNRRGTQTVWCRPSKLATRFHAVTPTLPGTSAAARWSLRGGGDASKPAHVPAAVAEHLRRRTFPAGSNCTGGCGAGDLDVDGLWHRHALSPVSASHSDIGRYRATSGSMRTGRRPQRQAESAATLVMGVHRRSGDGSRRICGQHVAPEGPVGWPAGDLRGPACGREDNLQAGAWSHAASAAAGITGRSPGQWCPALQDLRSAVWLPTEQVCSTA